LQAASKFLELRLYVCMQDAKKLQRSGQSLGVGYKTPIRQASDVRSMQKSALSRGPSEASTRESTPQKG
jgi:hypothetical protein